ncbi:ABC transporter substrate-binding protein [Dapis sp. BLCC M229]|uniref:ABC transporter substrate-binding protein n=1 Tax=Dapis sp. BLCC M229 TaxID=3400188 RepID=UPI003CF1C1DC
MNKNSFFWVSVICSKLPIFKLRSLLLATLFLSVFAVSCKTTSPTGEDTSSASPKTSLSQSNKFDGIEIDVISLSKPVAATVEKRADEFEALTGAKITVKSAGYSELYQTILQDLTTGSNQYDVMIMTSNWMPDYIESGYLKDLTEYVNEDSSLAWKDIAPFFQEYGPVYANKIYAIPIDGNYHLMYYRADLLAEAGFEPPKTWDDYLKIAKYFHDKDLNDDGEPDYGSCLAKKPGNVTYWAMWSIAASLLQSQGTKQGIFFDPNTMKPMTNNVAFAKALDIYKATNEYGAPDEMEWGLNDGRQAFVSGRCALSMDHGDIGTLALLPGSKVKDKFGTTIIPGSTEVLNWDTGELVECDKFTCPFAINGVNHAPFTPAIGWAGTINTAADLKVQAAGVAFISYISQPDRSNIDVTNGQSGLNPYRLSQFSDSQNWIAAGMTPAVASTYLGAIGASLNSPNVVLDLTIPRNYNYQRELLDAAVSEFLGGKISRDEAMARITQEWENLTNNMGRDSQKAFYRKSLGLDL